VSDSRPLRADARRNRELLLDAAGRAFTRDGQEASLEAVAKDAGVGIGTLYRHFPTREALVEATYRHELDRLCDAADELLTELAPDAATRAWMDRFVGYMTAKRGMSDTLRAIIASGGDPYVHTLERLLTAVTTLLTASAEAGTLRADVRPEDVLAGISGVSLAAYGPAPEEQSARLLDLLMDGLRYRPDPGPARSTVGE
jgi:AcrR family transcriptional regulator